MFWDFIFYINHSAIVTIGI